MTAAFQTLVGQQMLGLVLAQGPPAAGSGLPAWFQIVSLVLGAGGVLGAVVAIFVAPANRRKINADTANQLSAASLKMAENADVRSQRLEKNLNAAEERVAKAETKARQADERAYRAEQRADRQADQLTAAEARVDRQSEVLEQLKQDLADMRDRLSHCPGGPYCPLRAAADPAEPAQPLQDLPEHPDA